MEHQVRDELSPVWRGVVGGGLVGGALLVAFPTVLKLFPLSLVSPEMARTAPDPGDGSGAGWGILLIVGAPTFLLLLAGFGALAELLMARAAVQSWRGRALVAGLGHSALLIVCPLIAKVLPSTLATMGFALTLMFAGPVAVAFGALTAAAAFGFLSPKSEKASAA